MKGYSSLYLMKFSCRVTPLNGGMGRVLVLLLMLGGCVTASAQLNTRHVMMMGRNALFYEDYVLAINRFNSVIQAKPYMHEPYYYRGVAKFYLEDYAGANADCTRALDLSPYNSRYYQLRALCRINLEMFQQAEDDYRMAIHESRMDQSSWHNMVICQMEQKKYHTADSTLDEMMRIWPREPQACTMKAEVALQLKDTILAETWVDSALVLDSYNGNAWSMKAQLRLSREDYKGGEDALDKAIMQKPREAGLYINRALARYNQQNLRGAMSDYDHALDIDNSSYIAHFNRGLLRAQVGDDNRAIEDFNFVLQREPKNMIALYNRALLLDQTGDYRGAIRDISRVIQQYPQFWAGYMQRAAIRRKIGDTYGAERDEFKVLQAEMAVRTGTYRSRKTTRPKSDNNIDDYNKLVVEDEEKGEDYASEIRGKVQNHQTEIKCLDSYVLTFYPDDQSTLQYHPYTTLLENSNRRYNLEQKLSISCGEQPIDSMLQKLHYERITSDRVLNRPLQLAMDYRAVRDVEDAEHVLDSMIAGGGRKDALLYFLRAQFHNTQAAIQKSTMKAVEYKAALKAVVEDLDRSLRLAPDFAYAAYNRGNVHVLLKDYDAAIRSYTEAIRLDDRIPQAYYNRGIANILKGDTKAALPDLSVAGELGLYQAYSLIKKYSK